MKIGLFEGKRKENNYINEKKLKHNIDILSTNSSDTITKYILKIYNRIFKRVKSRNDIYNEIKEKYNTKEILEESQFSSCDVMISTSHKNTYHLVKQLNIKKENLAIICFDMHCDLYDANEELWKGNPFSKLIKEKYLSNLICYGIPKKKWKMTMEQIDRSCINKVYFANSLKGLLSYIKRNEIKHILFSIDIDCFDSYKKMYSAIPYSPYRILYELSKKNFRENMSIEKLNEISKDCVFIKHKDGYENMYHVGENNFNIRKFNKIFKSIISFCIKNDILIGYEKDDIRIIGDIVEVEGDDINANTLYLINALIDRLEEVRINEKIISKKIS